MGLQEYINHHNGDKPMTFGQYERYITGWRKSQPWYRKGMSLAHASWCEDNWPNRDTDDVEFLHLCWDSARDRVASALCGEKVTGAQAAAVLAIGDRENKAEELATRYFYLIKGERPRAER
jgi:hypothetical protein